MHSYSTYLSPLLIKNFTTPTKLIMFLPTLSSSSKVYAIAPPYSVSSESEEGISTSTPAPNLPPEVVYKIISYLIQPYEPIKSAAQLYCLSIVNISFYLGLKLFLKSKYYKQSEHHNAICNDISFLKKLKDFEKSIDKSLLKDEKTKRSDCRFLIHNITNNFNIIQIHYGIQSILNRTQHIGIDLSRGNIRKCLIMLDLLSQKTDIQSLSIIANSFFSSNLELFIKKLSKILNKNKRLSVIRHLSLKNSNINNDSAMRQIGSALEGKTIIKLNLSKNVIGKNSAIYFSNYLKHIKIHTLDISSNQIDDIGLLNIIYTLPKELKHLNISHNNIGPSGMHFLLQKLRKEKTEVEFIWLAGNNLTASQFNYKGIKNKKNCAIEFVF